QRSPTTKPCSGIVDGSWTNEIASIAVDARLNAVALKKKRSSTPTPHSAFVYGSGADEIVTDSVDERFNTVADTLDMENDIRGEDADTLDIGNDIRDEDADTLDAYGNSDIRNVGDQSLSTNSNKGADALDTWNYMRDQNAEILDSDGDSEVQIAEDQSLFTDFDEDADIHDVDGNGDIQIVEDQSLPTNSEGVAGSPRKRKRDKARSPVTDPHNEINNTNCTENGQANTFRLSGTRKMIIFDIYGRPCDVGSEQFATDIGRIVRANSRPAIKDWKVVPNSTKENIWRIIVAKYVVPEVYKPNILSRARVCWKNWKSRLRAEMDKHETIAEKKENMPERFITKREDWESFVDFCNTDEDRKLRAIGKKSREAAEFIHSCGRKGIYRTIYELEKESPTGEVPRSAIFLHTHVSKTMNDPESTSISDIKMRLIKELVEANPDSQNDIENDAVALVCGRDTSGHVRGMGGGVSRTNVRASATVVETLRKVQQENKSLQSDIQLLIAESGKHTQNHTSTPSHQSLPNIQNRTSTLSYQSASQAPDASDLSARSCLAPHSRLAPPASKLPARSRLTPLASNLPASSCFIKNFKGRTIALGSFNIAGPPMEHVYSLIIEDIFDRDAELFDKDGKLGDIMIDSVINWPKACVESNLPADSCFIRNFKRKTIGFGSFSIAADPQMEHVYSVTVKEIYDRDAELFDTDGKLGDIMIGGVINWPKACIRPCRQ
ncbi:hypothetical protein MKW94_024776, partial [Papaver nudicaule]|nr:hypothetical protein [Papaver nudicaule]